MRFVQDNSFRTAVFIGVLLLLPLLVLLVVLARGKELDARHRPGTFSETFDFGAGTLAGYDDYARRRLRAARPDLADDVIDGLAPFRLEPAADCPRSANGAWRAGIVLTHDLQESPYTMRALGSYFQNACLVVYGLLLPGHGTLPGELLDSGWQDWFAAQRFATRELGREVETLYLGGLGVGATLAMLEAATNAGVDGLVLVAPRLDVQRPPWQAAAARALGAVFAPARWASAAPAASPYRDPSLPWRTVRETNNLVASTQAALVAAAEIPVFTALSLEDATVDAQAVLEYMRARSHPLSHTFLFTAQALDPAPGMTLRRAGFPEYGRLSAAHTGLVVRASDPVLGSGGTSRECSHYFGRDADAYAQCMAGEADYLGEITPDNLAQGVIERITHNPYFSDLLRGLDPFIAPVGRVVPRVRR